VFELLYGIGGAWSFRFGRRHFILRKAQTSERDDQQNHSCKFFHFFSWWNLWNIEPGPACLSRSLYSTPTLSTNIGAVQAIGGILVLPRTVKNAGRLPFSMLRVNLRYTGETVRSTAIAVRRISMSLASITDCLARPAIIVRSFQPPIADFNRLHFRKNAFAADVTHLREQRGGVG
jgi:hypothetical protein